MLGWFAEATAVDGAFGEYRRKDVGKALAARHFVTLVHAAGHGHPPIAHVLRDPGIDAYWFLQIS
jgi:hypothetical protein